MGQLDVRRVTAIDTQWRISRWNSTPPFSLLFLVVSWIWATYNFSDFSFILLNKIFVFKYNLFEWIHDLILGLHM